MRSRVLAVLTLAVALVATTAAADPTATSTPLQTAESSTAAPTETTPPPAPVEAPSVWAFGDSITYGTWLADPATQSWPAQLDELMGPGQQVRDYGVGGQAVAYADPGGERMDAYVLRTLAAAKAAGEPLPRVLLFAGGINDLIRSTDVGPTRWAVYQLGVAVQSQYPSVTFRPLTLTPYRTDAGYAAALSVRRGDYNQWARDMYGSWLIDTGDVLTAGATYADPRYFLDPLHPNAEGAHQLAVAVHVRLSGQRGYP